VDKGPKDKNKTNTIQKPMRKTTEEQNEAKEKLLGWIKRGDTVYTVCDHVSRSGMMRHIRLVVPLIGDDGKIHFIHPNFAAATVLGYSQVKKGNNALKVGGCGMDMGFHLVYSLAQNLFGDGYALNHEWL
jgi:hypothetical protein